MIIFDNVSKTYANGTEALKDINIKIDDGEFVFIVGASGAGKSTFLKIMMREEVPNKGTVTINNYNLNNIKKREIPYFRRTLGIVFQDFRLISTMTVFDNVAFAMRVIGAKEKEIRKRVPYILSLVGLSSKARHLPNQLSGGEQQRVALARALVNNAGLIIADEPTGNIDPEMSYEIVDLLNHINANGTTVVMVTHEHNLVRHFHHRVITIDQGTVVSDSVDTNAVPEDYSKYEQKHPSEVKRFVKSEDKPADDLDIIYNEVTVEEDEKRKEYIESVVTTEIKVDDEKVGKFFSEPNSDPELEKFIQNYGVEDDSDFAEDDIDYSVYLDSLTEENGGNG
ncbi:MAG: cell division ATP-binding protein FtsE [Ruminococcaceae bacterium]|nr:cell division ATP-binding protein FtsE [Oscillospiraceae bacterium]